MFLRLYNRPLVSISMASGSGLFNQDTCDWDMEVLGALPVSIDQLGELDDGSRPVTGLTGRWAKRWPALKGVPWFPALGDGACSNVGSNCTKRTRMALMVGTSGALRVLWKATNVPTPDGLWRYRLDRDYIIVGGALSNGGNLMRWLQDTLNVGKRKSLLREVEQLPPDGHGLTVLPFLAGERSPDYRADARGTISGLSLSTTPAQIVRASMEAVSYRFGLLYKLLSPVAPDATEMVVNGGAILNRPVWMQITADVLGRRLVASSEREATSRGAALAALHALGDLRSLEDAPDHFGEVFQPNEGNHAVYEAALARQDRLYDLLVRKPDAVSTAASGSASPALIPAAAES
jgi:gluconokinase